MSQRHPGTVLVTGASSGIGAASALRLSRRGFTVYAGVRRDEDGAALIRRSHGNLWPIQLDVTSDADVRAAVERIERDHGPNGLSGLVNNAGIAVAGPLETLALEDWREQFEINVMGTVAMTRACIPLLRQRRGRIVNISSFSGRFAPPFMGPYAASKFALEALSDSLRIELQPWGIEVALIEPGSVATGIWKKGLGRANSTIEAMSPEQRELYRRAIAVMRREAQRAATRGVPATRVARVVEHALTARRPRTRYVVGRDAKLGLSLARFLPDRLRDRIVTRRAGLPGRGSAARD